jgi:hypothetical protein
MVILKLLALARTWLFLNAIIKMTKPIELERHQWNTIFERIQNT